MKVWVLILYMAGGTPGDVQLVDNIVSQEACESAGKQMIDVQKSMNSSNRYLYRCFDVEKAQR